MAIKQNRYFALRLMAGILAGAGSLAIVRAQDAPPSQTARR